MRFLLLPFVKLEGVLVLFLSVRVAQGSVILARILHMCRPELTRRSQTLDHEHKIRANVNEDNVDQRHAKANYGCGALKCLDISIHNNFNLLFAKDARVTERQHGQQDTAVHGWRQQ